MGINPGQVISKVNEATKEFEGMKVPVELDVDAGTKEINVEVFSPPMSGLLKKEIGIDKGSGEQEKYQSGNASIEQIISVAKIKLPNMLCKDLKAAVLEAVGSCATLGCLIENKPAIEIATEIKEGKYDKEIEEGKTETDPEKRKELDTYFAELKKEQDKQRKVEAEQAAAAEGKAKEAPAAE
jgi:large subunit ribosomal protein L11